jgi:hypothetical protein
MVEENEKLKNIINEALCYIYEVENVALFEKKNVMDTNKLKKILEGENENIK